MSWTVPAPVEVCRGLWRLGPHYLAVWLARGKDASCLFEVGVSGTASLVLDQLDSLGVPREEIAYVVLSHAHADHATGQGDLLAGLPRAELVLSQGSRDFLARPRTRPEYEAEDDFAARVFVEHGQLPALPPPAKLDLLPGPSRLAAPGERLDLGGLSLELGRADGHVPDGLTAWVPERGAWLASDSAGFNQANIPGYPLYFVSYPQYLEVLAEHRARQPEFVCPGHQHWFSGPDAARFLDTVRDELEREHYHIRKAAAADRTEEDIAQELFDFYYRDELTLYLPETILTCCRLLVRRSLEA